MQANSVQGQLSLLPPQVRRNLLRGDYQPQCTGKHVEALGGPTAMLRLGSRLLHVRARPEGRACLDARGRIDRKHTSTKTFAAAINYARVGVQRKNTLAETFARQTTQGKQQRK